MDLISDISHWSKNYLSLDNLVYQILQLSESGERDFNNLTNIASVRIALLDFYNDIKHYKEALKEIQKLQKHAADICQNESNGAELDKIENIDSVMIQKYSLLRPTALFNKKKYRVDIETRKLQSCSLKRRKSISDSNTSAESDIVFNRRTKAITSPKSAKSIMKPAVEKKILVAEPNFIEFYNCKPGLQYKKTIIVRNVYTQMARFRIEKRPAKTAFDIFVQSISGGDKEDVAPGMYFKIIVQYVCDPLAEPRELLVLSVKNGINVTIDIRTRRDPPVLQVGAFTSFGLSRSDTFSSSVMDTNTYSDSSEVKSSNNESSSEEESENDSNDIVKPKLVTSENRDHSVDSLLPCGGTAYATLDCKKCFVGELAIISTTLKNVGGNGRFFIMSELDWCFMRVVDMTRRNKLIVPPFAIWPSYFELQTNEEVTMCIYFFPDSYGLQVDELYIVSDNCSVKTIEIMGDGIMLEPRMFEFDKSIKYQWFQSENDALCTMRYLDLSYEIQSGLFIGAFVITYHCDLPLHYRWEKDNKQICPDECRNTIMRKGFDLKRLSIIPDEGIFHPNASILFNVTANIEDLPFEQYRLLLSLIIEDIPCAAVPSRFNYSYTKSKVDRRFCENTVDVVFQEIEVRAKHTEDEGCTDRFKREETLLTASIMNIVDYTNTTYTLTNQIALLEPSESSSTDSEDVCRFLKGYGTCDCCRTIITSTAVLRPGSPLFVGVEEKFSVFLINQTNKRLKFWWGNIIGPDHTKLKITIEPKFDFVFPGEPYNVKIKCLPLETGVISSLFIPCQFDGIHPVNLSIECTILSLSMAFYFPLECQESLFMPTNLRIEWDSSEYISKFDKKTGEVRLFKQKMKEEKIVHEVMLNSGESLNKTSSSDSYECEEDALSCETLSEIHYDGSGDQNQIADFTTSSELSKGSWLEEKESYDYHNYLPVLPYVDFRYTLIKKHFRYLPLIIEIHVNFQKTSRMRVYLENLSPISSDFSITTRNLWDKNDIQIHSDNSEFSEIMSGMVMSIEPMSGKIMPHDITFFEIVANSNTWGIYTDKITVNINLLPPFFFWIRVINDDLPISYPICKNSLIKIPKIRFQIYKRGCASEPKKLLLENTSNIPLYVNWHCFLLNEEEKPFNLIFDMLSPFISMEEYLATNTSLYNLIKKYFSCTFNTFKSKDHLAEIDEYIQNHDLNGNLENEFNDGSACKTKTQLSTSGTGNTSKGQYSNDFPSSSNNLKVSSKLRDIEFQLSIVPYYGKPDHNMFIIKPVELFLPPKQKRYISISVNSEKLVSKKVQCRACGFIRIPPIFRYKDNAFYRKDGHYLPPTQMLLECAVRRPKFILQSNRFQRTFEFHVVDFFIHEKTELKAKKKIVFKNFDDDALDVQFAIGKPFRVDRISTLRQRCAGANATVHPNENIEIELKCIIDKSWIDKAEEYRRTSPILTFVVLKKRLSARFRQGFSEGIEVFIKIVFPSLKLSKDNINFGRVELGQVTTAAFNIYNLADRSQTFEIRENTGKIQNKICKNKIFTFYPNKALLAGQSVSEMNVTEVKVNFIPKYPGNFEEEVEIISEIDGLILKFSLKGVATKLT